MNKLDISELKGLSKDVIEAWKLEGKDLGGAAQVLFYPIRATDDSTAQKPSKEEIFKYISVLKDNYDISIDRAKYILSEEKDRENKKIERILKEYAIELFVPEPKLSHKLFP